ncbi:hypothetical protein RSOL_380550 [Rhizoctonia solani AG-3 Rhs1AP]|uniref:Uncharacterized protein n=2 Tax=Rhizoctonia solani AG-3 TaxID=1086053 RepID=A0A074SSL0_9AGAM|nr:hypothetical protein RSOL_380550 [Rhizoctonia solani AG-3 Rhs1AP]KEP52952.1 hypothetical protein V565_037410 [Rhizoctonia solani 123E]
MATYHTHHPSRPGTADPSTRFQRAPQRSHTAPVRPPPSTSASRSRSYSSSNFARPPSRTGTPSSIERQARLRAREEERIRRDTAAVEIRISHNHEVLLKALDSVNKTAHKESERIRYDLERLTTIVDNGVAVLAKDIATLEASLRREETRVARDFQFIRQIQDPRKRAPELDRLEATLEDNEKQMAYEYSRLQSVRNAEAERADSIASALIQAKRNEETRLGRDLQRLHDARAEARRRVDEELALLAHRGLTEVDLPSLHIQVQLLRDLQQSHSIKLDNVFAAFTTQRSKATTEFNLEARRVTDMRREKKRALDAEMLRLTKIRNDCRLRIDAEISRFMTSERFTRASKPQPKPQTPPQTQSRVPPRSRKPSTTRSYTSAPQPAPQYSQFTTERTQQQSQAQQARQAWQRYEDHWAEISNSDAPARLTFQTIPWPVFSQPSSISQLNSRTIGAFLLSSLHDGGGSTRRDRIRNAMRLWHPDKWVGRYMNRVDPRHAQAVKDGVNAVARALTELLATA